MSGSGKRADQKKTLVIKLFGKEYFGKRGITSRKTERDKRKRINLGTIDKNIESYGKKQGDKWEIKLENYKILGDGELTHKVIIKAGEASKSAMNKVKKAGGEIIVSEPKADKKVSVSKNKKE